MESSRDVRFATVKVHENLPIARGIHRMRFACPEMADTILPGQFFMVRIAGTTDPLIGRAFALYDTVCSDQGAWGIDFAYAVAGNLTRRLTSLVAGQAIEVWGPLGNGFPAASMRQLTLVAGGIGYTPFLAVAQEALGRKQYGRRTGAHAVNVSLCYGARTADQLAGVADFESIGVDVHLATDDGSRGVHGPVTTPLQSVIEAAAGTDHEVYCCGPEPMMHAVSQLASLAGLRCLVSLESPMACGVGICFSCVAAVQIEGTDEWDYRRTCIDGPVFPAEQIHWDP